MDLEVRSTERTLWQTNTLDKISQSLGLMDHEDVSLDEKSNSQKNVIVFGMTQAGKTCMLLAVAGIAFEHQEYVETMLRAGQKKGGSSTSTAIIYKRSSGPKFGISYTSDGELASKPIFFETDDEFQHELKKIREKVEKNQHPDDRLIVYIPDEYFNYEHRNHNFNIIDLPGAGSRNALETAHVEKLRSRYFDTAHVKIIVCSIEENQSLQTTNEIAKLLPADDLIGWQTLREEYILIVTSAYSMESVKKYFSTPKNERTKTFEEVLEEKITTEVIPTFDADFNLEIFPLDVGDSFQMLCKSLNEEDRREVEQLREKTIQNLMLSIEQRKGNTLKSVIDKMDSRIKMNIKRQQQDVEKNRKQIQEKINKAEADQARLITGCNSMKKTAEDVAKRLESLKKCNDRIMIAKESPFVEKRDIEHILYGVCSEKRLKKDNREAYLKKLGSEIQKYGEALRKSTEEALTEVLPLEDLLTHADWSMEFLKYITGCINELSYELTPKTIWQRAPLLEKVISASEQLLTNARGWLSNRCAAIIMKINKDCQTLESQAKILGASYQAACKEKEDIENNQLPLLYTTLCQYEEEVVLLEEKKADAEKLISKWLEMAKVEYNKQYSTYKQLLYSNKLSVEQKVCLMITMGLMEQDAIKLLGLAVDCEGN